MEQKIGTKIKKVFRKAFVYEHWAIAWRRVGEKDGDYPTDMQRPEYRTVPCEKGFWQADPFLLEKDGKLYLFFEYMPFHSKRAVIGCREFTGSGFGPAETVLSEDVHLSYPAVFSVGEDVYMIPEISGSGKVFLYRAEDFPRKWAKVRELVRMPSVDSTVFDENTNVFLYLDTDGRNGETRKLYAMALDPATMEAGEPVLVREYTEKLGRPAGSTIRCKDGSAVRPVQDSRERYGGSMYFEKFSVENGVYRGMEKGKLTPEGIRSDLGHKVLGVHTCNRRNGIEVVDLFYRRFSLWKPFRGLSKKKQSKKEK